jgi:hypothetical protein
MAVQSTGVCQEPQPLGPSVTHVRTVLPAQIVAPGVPHPVPKVTPATGHWQEPVPPAVPWQVLIPTQATAAPVMWQLLASLVQVAWCWASVQYVPTWLAVQVLSQVQVWPMPEPLHVSCAGHVVSPAGTENGQLFPSTWQTDCVDVPEQKVPAAVQPAGAALHVQAFAPAPPVQL